MEKLLHTIRHIWLGDEKTWKVFWLYGVLGGLIVLPGISFLLGLALPSGRSLIPYAVYYAIYNSYYIWLLIALWRGAYNLEWRFFGHMVKLYCILGFLGLAFSAASLAYKPKKELRSYDFYYHYIGKQRELEQGAHDYCKKAITEAAVKIKIDPAKYMAENPQKMEQCVKTYIEKVPLLEYQKHE